MKDHFLFVKKFHNDQNNKKKIGLAKICEIDEIA